MAKGQYVELAREGTDRIFTIIAEFGDTRYAIRHGEALHRPAAGRQHAPTSRVRCTTRSRRRTARSTTRTLWQADYNRAHYEDMYFNRMAEYYETQSSGRYSVDGTVTEWVKVPFNEALLRPKLLRLHRLQHIPRPRSGTRWRSG